MIAVLFIVITGGCGVGLIAWWARDQIADRARTARHAGAPVQEVADLGPGLSPETVGEPPW